jgi:hypothetical protein
MKYLLITILAFSFTYCNSRNTEKQLAPDSGSVQKQAVDPVKNDTVALRAPILDTAEYNRRMMALAHDSATANWPVKKNYPVDGAVLPFKRVIAFYGNLYSTRMGILGELPPDQMLAKLKQEVKEWTDADSTTPAQPALHYIVVSAQPTPGQAGKYRLRMPFKEIDKVMEMAKKIDAIVFLDIQVGHSTVQQEVPELEKYLSLPNVHLGLDPEFSMKDGTVPGRKIGSFDAADINFATDYLARLVKKHNLAPKILVVHRFTQGMLTNTKNIKTPPEVQVVIDMDGFGSPAKKRDSYRGWITREPVQFTGLKLFYKNDAKGRYSDRMMTKKEVLALYPRPVYIQYQ